MICLITSDYKFFLHKDKYYSIVPWDEDFVKLFQGKVKEFRLLGRVYNVASIPNTFHPIDDRYFTIVKVPNWQRPRELIYNIGSILKVIKEAHKDVDFIFLRLPYIASALSFFVNFISLKRKPVASQLVGDAAKIILLRTDIVRNNKLRKILSQAIAAIIRFILRNSDVPGVVSTALAQKYLKDHQAIVANNSWLKEWMFYYRNELSKNARKKILFVGRFVPTKGIIELVDVELLLLQDGFEIDCVFVGDGLLRNKVEERIKTSGFDHCFSFKGWVKTASAQLFDIYRDCDILCLPSYSEGLGLVILEAMSNGVAVIASNVDGIRDVVEDGKCGLLIVPGSRQELKAAIIRFLSDENLRLQCVKNGYTKALENTYAIQRGFFAQKVLEMMSDKIGFSDK